MRYNCQLSSRTDKDRPSLAGEQGFTLVELVIASSISGVIIGVALLVLLSSMGAYGRGSRLAGVEQNAMLQSERLSRELRQAKKITQITESGTSALYTKIKFMTLQDTEITYLYDAASRQLVRRKPGTADRIVARIFQTHDDIAFIGFDENNNMTADPAHVKAVRLNLEVTDDKEENTSITRTMVFLRN
jgi:prepilin-type N-terminal cleavage/methylation domain-containing protein